MLEIRNVSEKSKDRIISDIEMENSMAENNMQRIQRKNFISEIGIRKCHINCDLLEER